FTLSGRLPIKESNQFLYAVSKARPVCCNDWALTSQSQGNSVFIQVSSRLRCAGEVLVLLWEYLVCEKFKRWLYTNRAQPNGRAAKTTCSGVRYTSPLTPCLVE